jgi:Putative motility protein
MNITNDTSVRAATSAAQSSTADQVNMVVLKKALDAQAASAQTLLEGIPQTPALATSGSVGTQLHAVA